MLDVNMLADVFNINRSWLSTKFREKMGVGISDYIVKCRIDKAKELLKTDCAGSGLFQQGRILQSIQKIRKYYINAV